jgi:hypothetical protein
MPALRVFAPYESVLVRARLGYGRELSRIESTVLRAIVELWRKRADEMESSAVEHKTGVGLNKLVNLFSLGSRVTLELIFDLWRRGHITLDLQHAMVAPTEAVVEAFSPGGSQALTGGEFKMEDFEVWLDRVSGHLTGRTGVNVPPDDQLKVPVDAMFDASTLGVSGGAILKAVRECLIEQQQAAQDKNVARRRGRDVKVMETRLVPDHDRPAVPGRAWYPIDVTVHRDLNSDEIRIIVPPGGGRTPAQCERAGRLLTAFVEQRPNHTFSRRLLAVVSTSLANPPSLDRNISQLERLLVDAVTAPAGTRTSLHSQLVDSVRTIRAQIEERIDGEAEAKAVHSAADYRQAVHEVIGTAYRQIVLIASVLHYDGLIELLTPLREAITRGAQVVLLWGRDYTSKIDSQVERVFEDLKRHAKAHHLGASAVVVSSRPAKINVNAVIADNRAALLGSFPYLGRTNNESDPLGVVITNPGHQDCEPIEAMLRWVRRTMPDSRTASAVLCRGRDFQTVDESRPEQEGRLSWSDLPAELVQDVAASEASVRAWAQAWGRCLGEARNVLALRRLPSVALVEDGAHRDALWDGIRAAKRQVVIGSQRLTTTASSRRLVSLIQEQLDVGVRADVCFRYTHREAQPMVDLLRDLAKTSHSRFALRQVQADFRALLSDDDVVISNFDFLSHEGFYRGAASRKPPAELGLRISGSVFAGLIAQLLGAQAVPRSRSTAKTESVPVSSRSDLVVALDGCPPTDVIGRARLVAEAVRADGSDRVLQELVDAGVSGDVLQIAAASVVRGGLAAPDDRVREWSSWLVDELWSSKRFTEAWLLRRAVTWSTLPMPMATVAALSGSAAVGPALENAALELSESVPGLAALVAFGSAQLLAWPGDQEEGIPPGVSFQVREVLAFLADSGVAPCWKQLAAVLAEGSAEADSPGVLKVVRHQMALQKREADQVNSWGTVGEAFSQAEAMSFSFESGLKTHARLFHLNGFFGELNAIIKSRDAKKLVRWATQPELDDLPDLVDTTTKEVAGMLKNSTIIADKRRVYINRLETLREAARHVVALTSQQADPKWERQRAVVQPLVSEVAMLWPELQVELADQRTPERHLTEYALSAVREVAEWGRA